MTHQETHVEASLLYAGCTAPIDTVDVVALQSMIEDLGHPVTDVRVQPGEYIHVICERVQILMAAMDLPFPMEHFRDVTCASDDAERQRDVMTLLAAHGASLNVLVLNRSDPSQAVDLELKTSLCRKTVDLLQAATSPDLVYWSHEGQLVTPTEAKATQKDLPDTEFDPADPPDENIFLPCFEPDAAGPATHCLSRASDEITQGDTNLTTEAFVVSPGHISQAYNLTERPAHLSAAPDLSADVRHWFEGEQVDAQPVPAKTEDLNALRKFLALDTSPEPRRMGQTALGRAALYVMSATIAVFSLPVGASILTYNALSGGSFRATSYVMALTGIGLALAGIGFALTRLG